MNYIKSKTLISICLICFFTLSSNESRASEISYKDGMGSAEQMPSAATTITTTEITMTDIEKQPLSNKEIVSIIKNSSKVLRGLARLTLSTIRNGVKKGRDQDFNDERMDTALTVSSMRFYHSFFQWGQTINEAIYGILLIKRYLLSSERDLRCSLDNIGSIMLVSQILSIKMNNDHPLKNSFLARCFSISNCAINDSEKFFLRCINWRTNIDPIEFKKAQSEFIKYCTE